ncbi:hypothetical protein Tco_1293695 [Tanacetum coccineum]
MECVRALVDKKRVIVTESSIRKDLHLMMRRLLSFFINQQLGDMSHHKKIFVNPFHTKKVFANMKRACKDFSGRITPLFDTMMVQDSKEVGEDSDHPTDSTQVLDLEKSKDAQAKEIAALKKRIQRLERKKMSRPTGLKRLRKVGMSRRVKSSKDQESLGAPEDASKQGRSIADIDVDVEVTLVYETQERQDDELMFDTKVLDTDEMHVEAKVDEKDEQRTKLDDSTAGEAVTTTSVEDSAAPTTIKEITLARTAFQIKQEELTDKEKAKLFMELMLKRRKHFAALKAQEKRNRPPTKEQKRTQMSTYLKHMAMGYKVQESKEKKEEGREETAKDNRKKMLGRKRVGKEQQQESSKKQKVEKEKESNKGDEVDEAELKKLSMIKKDEDIAIDAIPLATKLLVNIDYKLHKEGMMVHYQLIRANRSSKRYSSMIRILQGIDKEDLEAL